MSFSRTTFGATQTNNKTRTKQTNTKGIEHVTQTPRRPAAASPAAPPANAFVASPPAPISARARPTSANASTRSRGVGSFAAPTATSTLRVSSIQRPVTATPNRKTAIITRKKSPRPNIVVGNTLEQQDARRAAEAAKVLFPTYFDAETIEADTADVKSNEFDSSPADDEDFALLDTRPSSHSPIADDGAPSVKRVLSVRTVDSYSNSPIIPITAEPVVASGTDVNGTSELALTTLELPVAHTHPIARPVDPSQLYITDVAPSSSALDPLSHPSTGFVPLPSMPPVHRARTARASMNNRQRENQNAQHHLLQRLRAQLDSNAKTQPDTTTSQIKQAKEQHDLKYQDVSPSSSSPPPPVPFVSPRRPSLPICDTSLLSPPSEQTSRYPYARHVSLSRTGRHPAIPRQYRRVNQERLFMQKHIMQPTDANDADRWQKQYLDSLPPPPPSPVRFPPPSRPALRKDQVLFGLSCGFGSDGSDLAECVASLIGRIFSEEIGSERLDARPVECIQYVFERLHQFVQSQGGASASSVDVSYSGCELLIALFTGTNVLVGNVGSSRALLASRPHPNGGLQYRSLSLDHSFDSNDASSDIGRLTLSPGVARIDVCRDYANRPVGPKRLFGTKRIESTTSRTTSEILEPLTTVTRCIGCTRAHDIGVTHVPTIHAHTIDRGVDEFIVLMSDGITNVLTNEEVIDIIESHSSSSSSTPVAAIKSVIDAAHQRWLHDEDAIDDMSCTIIYLK